MKEFGGIQSPFEDAIVPVPSVDAQAGGGTKGGMDIPDGQKQSAPGELGTFTTTADLPGEIKGGPGTKRPSDMAGS